MKSRLYYYNTSDIGYMDQEWLDQPEEIQIEEEKNENEEIKDEEQVKKIQ